MKKGKDDNETEKLNGNRINERIKVICERAGLTSTVSYTEQKGTEKKIVTKKLCELIHSHLRRHSYIFLFTRNKKLTRNKLLDR